ncbi:hypothetical protein ACET3Z_014535 [Daucus carota]
MQDHCPNGEKCTFAHGVEELRVPPPNWQELVHAKSKRAWVNYPKMGGMMVCRYFFNGKACPYGEKCCYPHKCSNITEMARSLPIDSSAASIKTTGMMLEMRNDTGKSELMTPCSPRMSSLTINSSIRGKEMQLPSNSGGPRDNSSPAEVTETKFLKWKPPRKIAGIYELQGPGSHSKAEMSQDAPSFPKKALPQVVNDASSTKAELPTQERGNSGILPSEKVSDALSTTTEVPTQNRVRRGVLPASKLRGNVSLIYGDWPADDDDMVFSRGELYEFYVNLYLSIEFSS